MILDACMIGSHATITCKLQSRAINNEHPEIYESSDFSAQLASLMLAVKLRMAQTCLDSAVIAPLRATTPEVHGRVVHEVPDEPADEPEGALVHLGSLDELFLHCGETAPRACDA